MKTKNILPLLNFTKKTDKQLADEMDAADRLIARGWKLIPCQTCKGYGCFKSVNTGERPLCHECGGKGHTWELPPVPKS